MSYPSCEKKDWSCGCKVSRFFTETIKMKKISAVVKRHNYHYDSPKQVNGLYSMFYQSRIIYSSRFGSLCRQRVADNVSL